MAQTLEFTVTEQVAVTIDTAQVGPEQVRANLELGYEVVPNGGAG